MITRMTTTTTKHTKITIRQTILVSSKIRLSQLRKIKGQGLYFSCPPQESNTGHKFGSFLARCFIFTPGGRLGTLSTTIKSNLENMYPKGAFGRPRGQGLGPRGVNPYLSSDQSHIHTRRTSWDSIDDYQVKFGKYVS